MSKTILTLQEIIGRCDDMLDEVEEIKYEAEQAMEQEDDEPGSVYLRDLDFSDKISEIQGACADIEDMI